MRTVVLSFALLAPVVGAAAVYQAPDPEPTPVEVQILEAMNRFRADPAAEADRILACRNDYWTPGNLDWDMFAEEVRALPSAPPLVFDLQALDAARKHAYYMIHNGLGHGESEGKEGFVASGFADRMKKAGFTGAPGGENAFRDSRSAEHSNFAFIVDGGKGGPGGMQPGRGHRVNMARARFNVVGPAAVPHGDNYSVIHNFGTCKGRFAGGVVYLDRNGNGAYDIGEGRGGVRIATADGAAATTTWASGAYTLRLPGESAVTLIAGHEDQHFDRSYPAGDDNVKFDWVIPPEADLARADELIAAVASFEDHGYEAKRRFRALVELYDRGLDLCLDRDRRTRIEGLTAEVGPAIEAAKQQVLDAVGNAKAFKEAHREAARTYRKTVLEAWFDDAEVYAEAAGAVDHVAAHSDNFDDDARDKLVAMLEQAGDKAATPDFRRYFARLVQRARSIAIE